MRRLCVTAFASIALCPACGGPSSPAAPLTLTAATYSLQISANPLTCSGASIPGPVITTLYSRVLFTLEGSVWVGRPATSSDGDFVLRFAPGGTATSSLRTPVTGTLDGTLLDTGVPGFNLPGLSRIDPPAGAQTSLDGEIENAGRTGLGWVRSPLTFTNPTIGLSATCPGGSGRWTLVQLSDH